MYFWWSKCQHGTIWRFTKDFYQALVGIVLSYKLTVKVVTNFHHYLNFLIVKIHSYNGLLVNHTKWTKNIAKGRCNDKSLKYVCSVDVLHRLHFLLAALSLNFVTSYLRKRDSIRFYKSRLPNQLDFLIGFILSKWLFLTLWIQI